MAALMEPNGDGGGGGDFFAKVADGVRTGGPDELLADLPRLGVPLPRLPSLFWDISLATEDLSAMNLHVVGHRTGRHHSLCDVQCFHLFDGIGSAGLICVSDLSTSSRSLVFSAGKSIELIQHKVEDIEPKQHQTVDIEDNDN